jgi:uncharacterized protein
MSPDKKPFFAGTYLPKESLVGRMGMLELIQGIKKIWDSRRSEILSSAEQVTATLKQIADNTDPGSPISDTILERAFENLAGRFDLQNGGFGTAPKFPTPHNLFFLLNYWKRTGSDRSLEMVEKTLSAMRAGGVYDHVGFGFHRYSTDIKWLLPHFEKMLYDQALMAMAYLDAYRATGKKEYARTAREIFSYILRDMTDPEGGFYSAEDADSEGEEGKFYTWTEEEIRGLLDKGEADAVVRIFNIRKEGNFAEEATERKTGRNICYCGKSLAAGDEDIGISEEELAGKLEGARQRLFAAREKRIRPSRDDKILADWNGLMIAALARGGQALDEPDYLDAAARAVEFVLARMRSHEGRLLHRWRDGEAAVAALLDDYAFFIWGLLELYEATFEVRYLEISLEMSDHLVDHFWDDRGGGFFFTPDDGENLIIRHKEIYDGAVPSGNSVAMLNLLRLSRMTGNTELEEKAVRIGQAFSENIEQVPSAYSYLMLGVDFMKGPSYEIVIAGDILREDTKSMVRALRHRFIPNKVVLLRPTKEKLPEISLVAEYTRDMSAIGNKATAYVCSQFSCNEPTTDIDEMLKQLER